VTRVLIIPVLIALSAWVAPAQEWIRLQSGPTLRGEIIGESETEYTLIDMDGQRQQVKKSDVKRAKRRAFKKEVQKKLDATPAENIAARMEIAAWAAESKKLKRDAPRIALRVLAHDPDHAGAREMLGHVRAMGHWYRDIKTANSAVSEKMTADGYVLAKEAWVKADRKGEFEADPEAWMIVQGLIWRKTDEVMAERGFHRWQDQWYPPEEKALVTELKRLEKRTEQTAQAARVGSVEVYHVSGRDVAKEHAEKLMKARTWFCETMKIEPRRLPLMKSPVARVYVLEDMAALSKFGDTYGEELGMTEQDRSFAMKQQHLVWKGLGHATILRHNLWRHLLVAQMGGDLTQRIWHHGFDIPAWFWVASAHNAEIAVYGDARVAYIGPDEYGRLVQPPDLRGMSLRDIKQRVRELYRSGEVPKLKFLFTRHYNQLSGETSIAGIALFHFFLENHREGWMKFLMGQPSESLHDRFARSLKKSYAQLDQEFKEWIFAATK
jgi:hypothetical protein